MSIELLKDYAVVVSDQDNLAVVKFPVSAGQILQLNGHAITIAGDVNPGHRFATRAIPAGEFVRQYGQPIGTSLGIAEGDPITHANMTDDVPVVRDLPENLHTPAPSYLDEIEIPTFMGYRRPDGRVGTRNWILIVPTSMCSSHEALQISMLAEFTLWNEQKYPNVSGVTAIPHNKGCGCNDGSTVEVLMRSLAHYADHPNVGGVILIDLGCEKTNMQLMGKYLGEHSLANNKPIARLGIQDVGGTQAAIKRGLELVEGMLEEANKTARVPVPASEMILGLKCGGSDGFSGLSANPALGVCSDLLIRAGGTAILTEVPEFCGAEHLLAQRSKDAPTGRAVYELVDWYKDYASKFGGVLNQNPSPGNKAGGLLNITIKSLGAIAKGGTSRVEGVIGYAERVKERGLNLMQGPGYDQESTPGLVASGANIVVFTTGRGTTIGNAIAPVVKMASNSTTFNRMSNDLDINAGTIIDGTETIQEVGERLFQHLLKVASGEIKAHAETNKHREFQVWAEQAVAL
ncbi:MAG: altronate dehydratase [Acidobacteria bacterium]|nr:altronate dehydratase [Acidobacteriota bacterium]